MHCLHQAGASGCAASHARMRLPDASRCHRTHMRLGCRWFRNSPGCSSQVSSGRLFVVGARVSTQACSAAAYRGSAPPSVPYADKRPALYPAMPAFHACARQAARDASQPRLQLPLTTPSRRSARTTRAVEPVQPRHVDACAAGRKGGERWAPRSAMARAAAHRGGGARQQRGGEQRPAECAMHEALSGCGARRMARDSGASGPGKTQTATVHGHS
jgi:hypothetical protein